MATKMGRPPKPEGEGKFVVAGIRLTAQEKGLLETHAKGETKTFSAWAREILLAAAKKK